MGIAMHYAAALGHFTVVDVVLAIAAHEVDAFRWARYFRRIDVVRSWGALWVSMAMRRRKYEGGICR